ncbi:DUF3102 domain-containing protein [Staphylococcus epidermidis]|nr:DUF3102 domain-containing protein [Staphylococcus epidermidis]
MGRRLKHVKENDLAHGEFGKWLEQIGIESSFARKSMQISKELSSNSSHVNNLGIRALYQIATIPEEQREEKQQTYSEEMKF